MHKRAIQVCVRIMLKQPVARVAVTQRRQFRYVIQLGSVSASRRRKDLDLARSNRIVSWLTAGVSSLVLAVKQLKLTD